MQIGKAGYSIIADNEYKLFKITTDKQIQFEGSTTDAVLRVQMKLIHSVEPVKWTYEKAGKWTELPVYLDKKGEEVDLSTDYSQLTLPSDYSIMDSTQVKLRAELMDVDGHTYFDEINLYRLGDKTGVRIILSNNVAQLQRSVNGLFNTDDLSFEYLVYNNKMKLTEGDPKTQSNVFSVKYTYDEGELEKLSNGYRVKVMSNTYAAEQQVRLSFNVSVLGEDKESIKTEYFNILNMSSDYKPYFSQSEINMTYAADGSVEPQQIKIGMTKDGKFVSLENFKVEIVEENLLAGALSIGANSDQEGYYYIYTASAVLDDEGALVKFKISSKNGDYSTNTIAAKRKADTVPALSFRVDPVKLSFTYYVITSGPDGDKTRKIEIVEAYRDIKADLTYGSESLLGAGNDILETYDLTVSSKVGASTYSKSNGPLTVSSSDKINFRVSLNASDIEANKNTLNYELIFTGKAKIKGGEPIEFTRRVPVEAILSLESLEDVHSALDKEYQDRVDAVEDAIDKAEKDAVRQAEILAGEIFDEAMEWEEAFQKAKESIDNSIENVSKELGLYIESTDEIIGGINDTITALDGSLTDISDNFDNYVESTDQVLSGLGSDLSGLINENVAQGESITKIIDNQEEFTRQIGVWENGEDGTLRAYISANTQTAKEISTSLGEWNVDEKGDTVAKFVTDVTQSAQEIKESLGSWQNGETGTVIGHLTNVIKTAEGITETIGTWTEDGTGETLSKALLEVKKTADGVKTTVGTWDNPANGTVIKKVSEVEQTANGVKTTVGSWDDPKADGTVIGKLTQVEQTAEGITSTVSSNSTKANYIAMLPSGKMLFKDEEFREGSNGLSLYNNSGSGNLTLTRIPKPSDSPTRSTHAMQLVCKGAGNPGLGGFFQNITSRANAVFVQKFIAKIPVGYTLVTASNSIGDGAEHYFVGGNKGTGKYETYHVVRKCGQTGSFSTSGHIYLSGATPTTNTPLSWFVASATVVDITDSTLQSGISAMQSEIKQTSDVVAITVTNGVTASGIKLTKDALDVVAKDINLKGNAVFASLVEGDGTTTQILGGKIKTNSISANKLILSNTQSIVQFVHGENVEGSNITWTSSGYWHANFPNSQHCNLTEQFTPVKNLDWTGKNVNLKIQGSVFSGSSSSFRIEVHFYTSNKTWIRGVYSEYVRPVSTNGSVSIALNLGGVLTDHMYYLVRIAKQTPDTSVYGMQGFSIVQMNAGELIVDGSIKANHLVAGKADIADIHSKIITTDSIVAGAIKVDQALINKLTVEDLLAKKIMTQNATITGKLTIGGSNSASTSGIEVRGTDNAVAVSINNAGITINKGSISAGAITTGTISADRISTESILASNAAIKGTLTIGGAGSTSAAGIVVKGTDNAVAVSINNAGITINKGSISAGAITAGTITAAQRKFSMDLDSGNIHFKHDPSQSGTSAEIFASWFSQYGFRGATVSAGRNDNSYLTLGYWDRLKSTYFNAISVAEKSLPQVGIKKGVTIDGALNVLKESYFSGFTNFNQLRSGWHYFGETIDNSTGKRPCAISNAGGGMLSFSMMREGSTTEYSTKFEITYNYIQAYNTLSMNGNKIVNIGTLEASIYELKQPSTYRLGGLKRQVAETYSDTIEYLGSELVSTGETYIRIPDEVQGSYKVFVTTPGCPGYVVSQEEGGFTVHVSKDTCCDYLIKAVRPRTLINEPQPLDPPTLTPEGVEYRESPNPQH